MPEVLNITSVSRQVHAETKLLLFRDGMFSVHPEEAMIEFFARTLPWQWDAITRIHLVYFVGNSVESIFESDVVLKLKNVKEVIVNILRFYCEPEQSELDAICAVFRERLDKVFAAVKQVEFRFPSGPGSEYPPGVS